MSYEEDYFTDFITNRSISFIKRTRATRPESPFLAVISHAAPHGPETPAPQYSTAFPDAQAPRYPNWNFISLDKQWILRQKKPMDAQKTAFVDLLHRRRLQTLLSVDDSVARIFNTLQSLGVENETYIFLSSDHGYHLGQFGLVKGKSMPFESDIRVPFYVRGPTIPKNIRMKEMVLNIDIAPTFLDIAGVTVPKDMDGTSIMKLFRRKKEGRRSKRRMHVVWRDTILIERSRGWRRTKSMMNSGLPSKSKSEEKSLNKTETTKERKTKLLENICNSPKHQSPCKPRQLWECVTVGDRPRLRKCRKSGSIQATTTPTTRPTPSSAPTSPVKMCVCMKPRPGSQGDMSPYNNELLRNELDYLLTKQLRRRSKRSRYSYVSNRPRRSRSEFNARRYYKELARAQRLQNRRARQKMLHRTPITGTKSNANDSLMGPGVQEVVEAKLGKLKEKIWEVRMRLGALRDRRKKLLMISARDRMVEYACPCNPGNSTKPERVTEASVHSGEGDSDGDFDDDNDGDNDDEENNDDNDDNDPQESQISPLKRLPKATSRKAEVKQKTKKRKKVKTSLRRTFCSSPGLNCFYQTNDHWKFPPLWTGGDFCFCPNAANNSYWCLRTINSTHNFLYCEFITHFLEFFDLNQDPYQLYNVIDKVSPAVLSQLHEQLNRMRACRGGHQCNHYHGKKYAQINATSVPLTTPRLMSTSKETQAEITTMITDSESGVYNNRSIAVLGGITTTTMPSTTGTSAELSSTPLHSSSASEERRNLSEGIENTTESAETAESSKASPMTTLAPTEKEVGETMATGTVQKRLEGSGSYTRDDARVVTYIVTSKATESATSISSVNTVAPTEAEEQKPIPPKPTVIVKTTTPSSASPSTSEDTGKPSEVIAITPKLTDATSTSTNLSRNDSQFTTSAPTAKTESKVRKGTKNRKGKPIVKGGRKKDKNGKKEKPKGVKKSKKSKKKSSRKSKTLTPTGSSVFPDKATKLPTNSSNEFNENVRNESEHDTVTQVNIEKPSESVVTSTTSADDPPIVGANNSTRETSSTETTVSTLFPTSLVTLSNEQSTKNVVSKEYSTVKQPSKKSTKRRKKGEKDNSKKNKKLRKNIKKSGKELIMNTTTSSLGEGLKISVNQTAIKTESEGQRTESGKAEVDEGQSKSLTDNLKKRNRKPSGKRSNRNSKKRSRKPSKRPTPSPSSQGGVTGGGIESPSDP
ncbi:extracellular sulfatase Sulf-1-like isoform X2 [Porites lutea]